MDAAAAHLRTVSYSALRFEVILRKHSRRDRTLFSLGQLKLPRLEFVRRLHGDPFVKGLGPFDPINFAHKLVNL